MTAEDVEEWLDNWIENELVAPGVDIPGAVQACRTAAQAAGISDAALTRAAGGDLHAHLAEEHAAISNAPDF
ncbi:hypothetical protein AA101099_2804 [Neoasaia chiangmaiensis NBRC 101099]|uniref:Uncharacterized protein n=1 Tax=Neoasaia chiangmaiensis TaxID=320497 RepID=A0A1U9KP38_9PROT|nr:hypothetical protein [Neoasaia chiangmaiensis]AQS87566.1 hypothetical protein A0U93_06035 [Neoasaia chiangmaiensis]GBR42247.1 hypothetical protein AA101099_2804 [Neoasaia chiangmaiensis NBRC 101099]GEN14118.1 hypothetical protein NCH01_05490 [Neoasaia chiangmaiensis]